MPVIYEPPVPHDCKPGYKLVGGTPPNGTLREPDAEYYRRGMVWQCDDCKQTWLCISSYRLIAYGHVTFRKERWYERWYREKFKMS